MIWRTPAQAKGWLLKSPRYWAYLPLAFTALLGVSATWLVFLQVTELEEQRQISAFSEAARDRIQVVQRELAYALGVVQDIASFFEVSHQVSRRQFREFVGPALRRNPGIRALGWVPQVPEAQRAAFLKEARRSLPSFRLLERNAQGKAIPAQRRPVHYPVLYVQPYPENKPLLGLDLAAWPNLLRRLEEGAADPRIHLCETLDLPGAPFPAYEIAAYRPVYGELNSAGRLEGFSFGIFQVGQVIEQALKNLSPAGVDMRFFSKGFQDGQVPFYIHASRARQTGHRREVPEAVLADRPHFRDRIPVGDRYWSVVCNPIPGYFEPDHWNSRLILVGGLSFTGLGCIYLFALIGRAQEVRRLVEQRTRELQQVNQALNAEIAERRQAEQALQILNHTLEHRIARRTAEAERRARDLEQFAYVASHDLKAPLRAIANLASWLKEDLGKDLKPETAEQLDLLCDRVARMHALVEGLLAYSRIGHAKTQVAEIHTAELVEKVVDSLAPPSGFRIEIGDNMPRIRTDPLQLGQVFANLIDNAISHHDRDQGRIRIQGRSLGEYVEFQVEDDGPGIPSAYHQRIFLMFQTLTVKDFGASTGIGLALVKKLVEEHGGTIDLDSGSGRGARFRFTWRNEKLEATAGREERGNDG